jgi:hypothetical protein
MSDDSVSCINIISDVQMQTLEDLISDQNGYCIDRVIKVLKEVYESNKQIYNLKNDKYRMEFQPIIYITRRYPDIWKQQDYMCCKYIDQYTREDIYINKKLEELKVDKLDEFENKIQMFISFNNNDACHMLLLEFPISELFEYYRPRIEDCKNEECLKNSNCKCHHKYYEWCNTCHQEEYKSEFLYKYVYIKNSGATDSNFKINKDFIFNIIHNTKKLTIKLYKNVTQLRNKTAQEYYYHFKEQLRLKTKSLKNEYTIAKNFIERYDKHDTTAEVNELDGPLVLYKYFDTLLDEDHN